MSSSPDDLLTPAQQELYDWLADYIGTHHHSPSIRQMMQAMGLRSPAPVQSRLRHLQEKGWITWQEGQARTLQLLGGLVSGIPVLGAVAAGGLVETFDDVQETLDLNSVLKTRGLFALGSNDSGTYNSIEFITIASLGNAQDFGDLTMTNNDFGGGCLGSPTRAVFCTGNYTHADYVQIMSTGNAIDFGNLLASRRQLSGSSNGHGGL